MKIKGFTMIEMVGSIALLGILAVAAMPSLISVPLTSARTNVMNSSVSAIQNGLSIYGSNQQNTTGVISYPTSLDSVTGTSSGVHATNAAPLFTAVTHNGISAQWHKLAAGTGTFTYSYDTNGNGTYDQASDTCFLYTVATGTFQQTTCP